MLLFFIWRSQFFPRLSAPFQGASSIGEGIRISRKAVIDVGSNSVKLYVAARGGEGGPEPVLDRVFVCRLGEGMESTGSLSENAMERTCRCIRRYVKTARALGCEEIAAVGTRALRAAKNSEGFIQMLGEASGVKVKIISGREEARLVSLALEGTFPRRGRQAFFDTGGGSTEFIFWGSGPVEIISAPLGALRIAEGYLKSDPVSPGEFEDACQGITAVLAEAGLRDRDVEHLAGMGGTVTSMGAVKLGMERYDARRIEGLALTLEEVEEQIALYRGKPVVEIGLIKGLPAERAPVILAGACIVREIMTVLGVPCIHISHRGLRHGLMHELFNG